MTKRVPISDSQELFQNMFVGVLLLHRYFTYNIILNNIFSRDSDAATDVCNILAKGPGEAMVQRP